jgi:nonribosomal peptide synthetase CepB
VLVGVVSGRSVDAVVAVLAVAVAGGGFVPVDPAYPRSRVEFMLADAGLDLVVCSSQTASVVPAGVRRLVLDDPETVARVAGRDGSRLSDSDRLGRVVPGDVAYVIYTSGSTGAPKGVVVTYAGLANLVVAQASRFGVGPGSRVLQFASLSFDAAVSELAVTLLSGAALVIADPTDLVAVVQRFGVTHVTVPPSVLAVLEDLPAVLGTVIVAGEACPVPVVQRWAQDRRLINAYGPTEATVCVSMTEPLPAGLAGGVVPIGRPIGNTRVWVLDEFLQPLPPGVVGDVYVAGVGLARGYLNQAGLTGSRFVACPFPANGGGERMYRTGDLARWTSGGELVFAGRADAQVKVRGHRVELGEVEAVLAGCPGVEQAVVLAREDRPTERRLVGYVTGSVTGEQVRGFAAERLPDYLLPAVVLVLDRLPVTPNGKIDRAGLPAPEYHSGGSRGPATAVEELLCGLYAEILGVEQVGVHDSFFQLGGDSITSMLLVSRARRGGIKLDTTDVFEHQTPAALAQLVEDSSEPEPAAAAPDAGDGWVPLTPVMRALAERAGQAALTGAFFQSMVIRTPAGLDFARLERALRAVRDAHDMLRARLDFSDDQPLSAWRLQIPPSGVTPDEEWIRRVDVAGLDAGSLRQRLDEGIRAAGASLDPAAGRLVQAIWYDAGPAIPGRLSLVAHHLAVDGVSWRILLSDLAAAYVADGPVPEPVSVPFRRWARALHEEATGEARRADLAGWQELLRSGDAPLGSRNLDSTLDLATSTRRVSVTIAGEEARQLAVLVPAAFHAGVDDVLLAALAAAIVDRRETGDNSLLVDIEGHGREHPNLDLSRTVGWFTSLHPVRLTVGAGKPDQLVKSVKEQLRAVPSDGQGFGLLRYLDPQSAVALKGLPVPQTVFNYLGRFTVGTDDEATGDWQPAGEEAFGGGADPRMTATHALEATALVREKSGVLELTLSLSWPGGLFSESRVNELITAWQTVLARIAAHVVDAGAGGHTPSDFALVSLGQDQIDELEAELSDGR